MKGKEEIVASLKFGKLLNSKQISVVILGFVSSLLLPFIAVIMGIMIAFGLFEIGAGEIMTLVLISFFGILFFSVLLCIWIKDSRLKRKVKVWSEDSVKIKAILTKKGMTQALQNPYQIIVHFSFDDKSFDEESETSNFVKGFDKFFINYYNQCGGKCEILYSPKYNQVMLCRI